MSNFFYPDNVKRYDRMQQLLNDVTANKALALQQIDQQKNITDRLDKICKDQMAAHGFKTLDQLHDSVAKTLPDEQKDRYLKGINTLKDFDNILGNASMYIGIVGSSAVMIGLPVDRKMRMIEMAHDLEQKAAWNRGWSKFWRGSPAEGWKDMAKSRRLMQQHMKEAMIMAGEEAPRVMRLWKTLKTVGAVMDCIANAIKSFFYYRFASVEHLKNILATVGLYSSLQGYLETKSVLESTKALTEEARNTTLTAMATKMTEDHKSDLDKITDESIWATCDDYDSRKGSEVYKTDDPDKSKVHEWLEEEAKKSESEQKTKTDDQKAQEVSNQMEKSKSVDNKTGFSA